MQYIAAGVFLVLVLISAAVAWRMLSPPAGTIAMPPGLEVEQLSKLPPLPSVGVPGDEPTEDGLLPVDPGNAVSINAAIPISTDKNISAKPFRSVLKGEDLNRAITCLAIASVYEAGGQADDQRPVMQTILNRVRHPAFPGTICGVVFQGQERRTGCQFSFTCDGSMRRWRPSDAILQNAKKIARRMISGEVDGRVGQATHYHTNWVVPYWSSSLDKITSVKTHLFFRWKGFWGTPAAFKSGGAAKEPAIAVLAEYSPAHAVTDGEADAALAGADADSETDVSAEPADIAGSVTVPTPPPAGTAPRRLDLTSSMQPGRWALNAVSLCEGKPECRVAGWSASAGAPANLDPASLAASPPDLLYVQVLRNRTQQVYWNCKLWPQVGTARCLPTPAQTARLARGF